MEQSRQQSASSPLVVHFQRYKSLRQREVQDEIAEKEKVSSLSHMLGMHSKEVSLP